MNKLSQCFIEPELITVSNKPGPASYVRKVFSIGKNIQSAVLQITALGCYKGFLNGQPIDGQQLMPGYTDYNIRLQVQSYDVTKKLIRGENVIGAIIGDGWYKGALGIESRRNVYGDKLKFACSITITYTDESQDNISTDETWKATQNGPLRQNDLKVKEVYDARLELAGWLAPDYDDSGWHHVRRSVYKGKLIAHEAVPITKNESFTPQVLTTPNGSTVLDFKQNMAGHVCFTVSGRQGHQVGLVMGEVQDKNGNFTQKNLAVRGASIISGKIGQQLRYTLKNGVQYYEPMFLISGFRYVKLINWPEKVRPENFKAYAIYSALRQTGFFECSDPLINKLVQNVMWSLKSNFVDIPTDCPTRERSGWAGDISVFCETACYLSDTREFLKKWLNDFIEEQLPDGNLPYVVPVASKSDRANGCKGWSDAIANVPYTLYDFYGDKEILQTVYDSIKRYVEFDLERAKKRNILSGAKKAYRDLVIETGFHYGEWLEPGSSMTLDYIKALFAPDIEVNTAWFYNTVKQLSEIAVILKKKDDAAHYDKLAGRIKKAYQFQFVNKGHVKYKRHCKYVRPVAMGLVDEITKKVIIKQLNEKCKKNDYRIGTGFLTTYRLLDVLADYGYVETAYRILENKNKPGWLYPVTKGATTTWENWYGIDDKGNPEDSHNHYAQGSVVSWLFSRCAGIRPMQPGFKKVVIKPHPGGTLTYANATYDSIHGKIISNWRIENNRFHIHVQTPAGMETVVILPDGQKFKTNGGVHDYVTSFI